MESRVIVFEFLVFIGLVGCFYGLTTDATRGLSTNDLYTEAPCEIHPLSAYKDIQGNIWGIGEGNLWWFNATNLSWSLLPMPNGTNNSEPWKVACVDPRKYVAMVGKNATLVLHLPWQHWQLGDADDVNVGYLDKDTTWCVEELLYATDSLRETLYFLDPEEARWTVRDDLPSLPNINRSSVRELVDGWHGPNEELILVEKIGNHAHVIQTNTSAIDWIILAENNVSDTWPNLNDNAVLTWNLGSEYYWLWQEKKNLAELWAFSYFTTKWIKGSAKLTKELPPLLNVLSGWTEADRFCILKRNSECTSQYSISETLCWLENEMTENQTNEDNSTTVGIIGPPPPTKQPSVLKQKQTSATEKSTTGQQPTIYRIKSPIEIQNPRRKIAAKIQRPKKPTVTDESQSDSYWAIATQRREHVTGVALKQPTEDPHYPAHTSAFGSIIFFGTSITIFSLFGMFWCLHRCVHLTKEDLLLGDPVSVRYTAIPDSIGYDVRRPTPSTYTVIPDSIA